MNFKAYSAESESKRAETQMQDRVRFEMANIKQTRLKMEYLTISKSEYDLLLTQAKRMEFISRYRPTLVEETDTGEYSITVSTMGIIETLRYSKGIECIDLAIKDIREMQKVFWIFEETEIYAGRTIEEILHEFFSEKECEEILRDSLYGEVDLNEKFSVKEGIGSIAIEKTIKELLDEMVIFPDAVLSSYA